jgi:hypothetical protein
MTTRERIANLEGLRHAVVAEIDREQSRVIPRDLVLDALQGVLADVRAKLRDEQTWESAS